MQNIFKMRKIRHLIMRRAWRKKYVCFENGKYSLQLIQDVDTKYITHALEWFILEEGMRYVLAQELVKRLKIKGFV